LPARRAEIATALAGESALVRSLAGLALALLRRRSAQALTCMDRWLANSRFVAGRLRDAFGIDADVLYPPCETSLFVVGESRGYYLSMARQARQKRVDLVIRAFLELPEHRLIVASTGSDAPRLRRLAANAGNIQFVATPSRADVAALVRHCVATLHVGREEAFGMAVVESLAAGKPAIVSSSGGAAEIVSHGRNGLILSADPEPAEIAAAVRAMTAERAREMSASATASARSFEPERFFRAVSRVLSRDAP
jgi:glycosyltransferase involved in cell wall biosynthesis